MLTTHEWRVVFTNDRTRSSAEFFVKGAGMTAALSAAVDSLSVSNTVAGWEYTVVLVKRGRRVLEEATEGVVEATP